MLKDVVQGQSSDDTLSATGYTRAELAAMHPSIIGLNPEWIKCQQCGRENSAATWTKFGDKCPNCGGLHDKERDNNQKSASREPDSNERRIAMPLTEVERLELECLQALETYRVAKTDAETKLFRYDVRRAKYAAARARELTAKSEEKEGTE